MSIFYEIHKDIPREGPGDAQSTRRAYQILHLPDRPNILDIGCGPGAQTIELAKVTNGTITAIDLNPNFLAEVEQRARDHGVDEKIVTRSGSMMELGAIPGVLPESYDLIWSEGAIYIMGFENGLRDWSTYLKTDGYLAVTELSWLTQQPPAEARDFWTVNYPGMRTIEANCASIEENEYKCIDQFVIPESGWWDEYYRPMEERINVLRQKYVEEPDKQKELDLAMEEIELYRRYTDSYGYVFYIMQKQ